MLMNIFLHHIYEYHKGIRNMILFTGHKQYRQFIEARLRKNGIAYFIRAVGDARINVFFGNPACIQVIGVIGNKDLHELTDEEDFILGIMLGYDRLKQCRRYVKRKESRTRMKISA